MYCRNSDNAEWMMQVWLAGMDYERMASTEVHVHNEVMHVQVALQEWNKVLPLVKQLGLEFDLFLFYTI